VLRSEQEAVLFVLRGSRSTAYPATMIKDKLLQKGLQYSYGHFLEDFLGRPTPGRTCSLICRISCGRSTKLDPYFVPICNRLAQRVTVATLHCNSFAASDAVFPIIIDATLLQNLLQ
jgi:hypothetical protein